MFTHNYPGSLTALNKYLANLVDRDRFLDEVWLKAEIGNFNINFKSGHAYLSLKDQYSEIRAIIWKNELVKFQDLNLKSGQKVLVCGKVNFYAGNGNLQLIIKKIELSGLGDFFLKKEQWKQEFNAQGYFDEKHKKSIPQFPRCIGIITSSSGAAVEDIIQTIRARWPIAHLVHIGCRVQGPGAAQSIANAIETANQLKVNQPELLIVGRGGGSIEDLWCFNEPLVVKSIFSSFIPIITGIGHAIDHSLADLVADKCAETPTSAAKLAVPEITSIISDLNQMKTVFTLSITDYWNSLSQIFIQYTSVLDSAIKKFCLNKWNYLSNAEFYLQNMLDSQINSYKQDLFNSHHQNHMHLSQLYNAADKLITGYQHFIMDKFSNIHNQFILFKADSANWYSQNIMHLTHKYQLMKTKLNAVMDNFQIMDPTRPFKKGFVLLYNVDANNAINIGDIQLNQKIVIKNIKTSLYATVTKIKH